MPRARARPNSGIKERDYQRTLTETLHALGWSTNWIRPVFDAKAKRWVTPNTAPGWPDITALHPRHLILLAIEVKSDRGRVEDHQVEWLHRFHRLPCARALLLRPSDDWNHVAGWFMRPESAPSGYGWLHHDPAPSAG